jgi:hypothetical protein
MPAKTGTKKSAKTDDENKKKDTTKGSKKSVEDTSSADIGSVLNDSSAKLATINAVRGSSQLGASLDDNSNKEAGISVSELSHHTDGNREPGETGLNTTDNSGANIPEQEVKYEEPILPNLIVLELVLLK